MRSNPTTSDPVVSTLEEQKLGRIAQIIGPVLDVIFPPGKMPNIYNALVIKGQDTLGQQINVTCFIGINPQLIPYDYDILKLHS